MMMPLLVVGGGRGGGGGGTTMSAKNMTQVSTLIYPCIAYGTESFCA